VQISRFRFFTEELRSRLCTGGHVFGLTHATDARTWHTSHTSPIKSSATKKESCRLSRKLAADAARITGTRNLSDFSVTDVLIELADPGPLLVGMKVDVYFQHEFASQ
jgi:hypothetical protein